MTTSPVCKQSEHSLQMIAGSDVTLLVARRLESVLSLYSQHSTIKTRQSWRYPNPEVSRLCNTSCEQIAMNNWVCVPRLVSKVCLPKLGCAGRQYLLWKIAPGRQIKIHSAFILLRRRWATMLYPVVQVTPPEAPTKCRTGLRYCYKRQARKAPVSPQVVAQSRCVNFRRGGGGHGSSQGRAGAWRCKLFDPCQPILRAWPTLVACVMQMHAR